MASLPHSWFVLSRWQHRIDGSAAICNCMFWGVRPQISLCLVREARRYAQMFRYWRNRLRCNSKRRFRLKSDIFKNNPPCNKRKVDDYRLISGCKDAENFGWLFSVREIIIVSRRCHGVDAHHVTSRCDVIGLFRDATQPQQDQRAYADTDRIKMVIRTHGPVSQES